MATVYVDAAIHAWRGGTWCHLFSEDVDALHAFAARLGVPRSRFQCPPRASWPHYDISSVKRPRALALGAVEADRRTVVRVAHEVTVAWCRVHRPDLVGWAAERRDRRAGSGGGAAR